MRISVERWDKDCGLGHSHDFSAAAGFALLTTIRRKGREGYSAKIELALIREVKAMANAPALLSTYLHGYALFSLGIGIEPGRAGSRVSRHQPGEPLSLEESLTDAQANAQSQPSSISSITS